MLPSAGGCDEFLRLYVFRRPVEREVLTELEGRLTGLRSEGERIKLHIVPLQDAWKISPDAKLLSCLTLYPPPPPPTTPGSADLTQTASLQESHCYCAL